MADIKLFNCLVFPGGEGDIDAPPPGTGDDDGTDPPGTGGQQE